MSLLAPVNKIIPLSVVDGPGNRTAVFLQGCNIACAYCHNPETQRMCCGCGSCVDACPTGALSMQYSDFGFVAWDESKCCGCDTCITTCSNHSSPKIRMMSAPQAFEEVRKNVPFIRGVTVSGGECMLRPDWLEEFFRLCHGMGLTTLADSNGTVDFSLYPSLMEVCDGVMLDVKSWENEVFHSLTGSGNETVLRNLVWLADQEKLEELRIVCLEGEVDVEDILHGIAASIPAHISHIPLKLIRFRKFGVRGRLAGTDSPTDEKMQEWSTLAASLGFRNIIVK